MRICGVYSNEPSRNGGVALSFSPGTVSTLFCLGAGFCLGIGSVGLGTILSSLSLAAISEYEPVSDQEDNECMCTP